MKWLSDEEERELRADYMREYRLRKGEELRKKQAAYLVAHKAKWGEVYVAKQAAYRAANKHKAAARDAARYQRTKEAKAAYDAIYRAATVEHRAAYAKAWREANPEVKSGHDRNRKARVRGAEGRHTPKEIRAMLKEQGGLCRACSVDIVGGFHADHIVPIIKGGSNWIANIQLLCGPCNLSKFTKDNEEFLARRSRSSVG